MYKLSWMALMFLSLGKDDHCKVKNTPKERMTTEKVLVGTSFFSSHKIHFLAASASTLTKSKREKLERRESAMPQGHCAEYASSIQFTEDSIKTTSYEYN